LNIDAWASSKKNSVIELRNINILSVLCYDHWCMSIHQQVSMFVILYEGVIDWLIDWRLVYEWVLIQSVSIDHMIWYSIFYGIQTFVCIIELKFSIAIFFVLVTRKLNWLIKIRQFAVLFYIFCHSDFRWHY
jgi:hypothetical protein